MLPHVLGRVFFGVGVEVRIGFSLEGVLPGTGTSHCFDALNNLPDAVSSCSQPRLGDGGGPSATVRRQGLGGGKSMSMRTTPNEINIRIIINHEPEHDKRSNNANNQNNK